MDTVHYNNWRDYYENHLENMYNIFIFYFKDLYELDKNSKDKFYKYIYQTL